MPALLSLIVNGAVGSDAESGRISNDLSVSLQKYEFPAVLLLGSIDQLLVLSLAVIKLVFYLPSLGMTNITLSGSAKPEVMTHSPTGHLPMQLQAYCNWPAPAAAKDHSTGFTSSSRIRSLSH